MTGPPLNAPGPLADLGEARRLHELGFKLCKLVSYTKRPEGAGWNLKPVSTLDDAATGYGVLLAANDLCSVDPDNAPLAAKVLSALGFDLEEIMAAGVRSLSTRPGSGGRAVFRSDADLDWIKFRFKEVGVVLELRAASPNLQDAIPGLVYKDKAGQLCTQRYVGELRLDGAPELPPRFLAWWRQMSLDLDFAREQQALAGKALGLCAEQSVSGRSSGGTVKLAHESGRRREFNEAHRIEDMLLRHGYEQHGDRFAAPNATGVPGVRAIPGKEGLWRSDHASDPLSGTFDAWTAWVVLDHDGDLVAAEQAADAARLARAADDFDIIEFNLDLEPQVRGPIWKVPPAIDAQEWTSARLSPSCIVDNYLYADVAQMVAAGGTGKTTLLLYEAVHVVLGIPLYGREIKRPGPVLILTAEDPREVLVARLREISTELQLTAAQVEQVRRDVVISDLTDGGFRLSKIQNDMVVPTDLAAQIVRGMKNRPPVLVIIDPAISFGVGESRVNDAEQGLIEAARRIRGGLDCCVRFVHHTGKQQARDRQEDQYAGRNGSAFADGSRMVTVMNCYRGDDVNHARDWQKCTNTPLAADEVGIKITPAKMSYAKPQPPIYLRRCGLADFRLVEVKKVAESPADANDEAEQAVLDRVRSDLVKGMRHSKESLGAIANELSLSRTRAKDAVVRLLARGVLIDTSIDPWPGHGAHSFLKPADGCAS